MARCWDEELFESAIRNDGLFTFITRIWVMSDSASLKKHIHDRVISLFHSGFVRMLGEHWSSADAARSIVRNESGGEADDLAKRIMAYLKHPAKPDDYILVSQILRITMSLTLKDLEKQPPTPTELMDNFIKNDMVTRVSRYLLLASSTPPSQDDSRLEIFRTRVVEDSIPLLMSSLLSRNAPHSAMLMLKQRFLRSITNLLSASPQVLDIDDDYQGALIRVLTKGIPLFVSHSPVVLQAIKPVKEILADGAAVEKPRNELFERRVGRLLAISPRACNFQCYL